VTFVLADVNLWLATILEDHPHHGAAGAWWRTHDEASRGPVAFCRLTQLGLLRLLTHHRVMGPARLTHGEAWRTCGALLAQSAVSLEPEPEGLDDLLASSCRDGASTPGWWSDAYLAAFARAAGARLATFDRGFERFAGLELDLLRA
jgi:toxin-antitoxin system PIN domain toxin